MVADKMERFDPWHEPLYSGCDKCDSCFNCTLPDCKTSMSFRTEDCILVHRRGLQNEAYAMRKVGYELREIAAIMKISPDRAHKMIWYHDKRSKKNDKRRAAVPV